MAGSIFEVVRGSNSIAEDLRLEDEGSRTMLDAAAVVSREFQSGDEKAEILKGRHAECRCACLPFCYA